MRTSKILSLAYGLGVYGLFLATFLYAVGFVGDFGVPRTIDSGGPVEPLWKALAIDAALMLVFAVQHSLMARPGFKRLWTRVVPQQIERATYCLFSIAALALVFWQWRPIPAVVWDAAGTPLGTALFAGSFVGWGILLLATFAIDHFDLFGVRQVLTHLRGRRHEEPRFQVRSFYKHVRHPLYVGWLTAFWCTPTMTVGHLLFALLVTGYILVAIQLEERDLVDLHGDTYRSYRRRVPMLVPSVRPAVGPRAAGEAA